MFAIPVDNNELSVNHGPTLGGPGSRFKERNWNLKAITTFTQNLWFCSSSALGTYRCKGFHRIDVKLLHMANLVNEVYVEQMVRDCEET